MMFKIIITFNIILKYNATIINMIVDVKKKDKKIDEITPHCQIYSYDEDNNPLNIVAFLL